jgi:integrin beta 8
MTVVRVPVTETVVVRVATGQPGTPGASAYDVAVANGFVGTVEEWLEDLQGADGADGAPGTPGTNGTNGTNGTDGADGTNGTDGADGDSAYQVAVNNGFVGDEAAWLASLQGSDGADGTNGTNGTNGTDGADGVGVPAGGTTGQVLAKNSGTDYDTEWIDPPEGGGGGAAPEVRHSNDGTYDYTGTAPNGTAEGSSGWTVTRITLTSPPVVMTGLGTWTGRAGLSYS